MASMEEEPGILQDEVISAVRKLTDGKAPGYDNVTAEELKATGETGINILHHLCNLIWRKEEFPEDWGRPSLHLSTRRKTSWTVETTEGSAF